MNRRRFIIENGFRRTSSAEGSHLTLERCKGKSVLSLSASGNTKRTVTIGGTEYVVPDGYTLLDNTGSTASAHYCKRDSDSATGTINLTTGVFTASTFTAGNELPTPDDSLGVKGMGDLVTDSTDPNHGKYKLPILIADNCGVVDLGTLTWSYGGGYSGNSTPSFFTRLYDKYITSAIVFKITADKYTAIRDNALYNQIQDMQCGFSQVGFCIRDLSFNGDTTAFKSSMSGVYLYYQRSTDASWNAPTITNAYLNAPILKVGDYADEVDVISGKVIRRIGVFDGSQITSVGLRSDFSTTGGFYAGVGQLPVSLKKGTLNKIQILCDCYRSKPTVARGNQSDKIIMVESGYGTLNFRNTDLIGKTAAEVLATLADMTFWVVLDTETEETMTPLNIRAKLNDNYAETQTTIPASAMGATYMSGKAAAD